MHIVEEDGQEVSPFPDVFLGCLNHVLVVYLLSFRQTLGCANVVLDIGYSRGETGRLHTFTGLF